MSSLFSSGPKNNLVNEQLQSYAQQNVMQAASQAQLDKQKSDYDALSKQLDSSTQTALPTSPSAPSVGAYAGASSPGSSALSDGTSRASFLGN